MQEDNANKALIYRRKTAAITELMAADCRTRSCVAQQGCPTGCTATKVIHAWTPQGQQDSQQHQMHADHLLCLTSLQLCLFDTIGWRWNLWQTLLIRITYRDLHMM